MNKLILDFYDGKLDGDSWEDLCQSCYKIRYQKEHYTEIPAVHGGDGGIEGFTRTGVVNQCYCHEKVFTDNELYEHQRNKMTKDINKLLKDDYKKELKSLGVPVIREWHFVVPFYKDSRIIKHAEIKRQEVLNAKNSNKQHYDYIDDDFQIIVKDAEEFKYEITRTIRTSLTDTKLNLTIRKIDMPDWGKCGSEKVSNIERKVKNVYGDYDENNEEDVADINFIVNTYVQAYIKGMEILRILRISYAEIYEDVYSLEQSYKRQVELKTRMNTNRSLNQQLFNQILDDFEEQLKKACYYFTLDSIFELKTDIIGMWLADCSMQFRK